MKAVLRPAERAARSATTVRRAEAPRHAPAAAASRAASDRPSHVRRRSLVAAIQVAPCQPGLIAVLAAPRSAVDGVADSYPVLAARHSATPDGFDSVFRTPGRDCRAPVARLFGDLFMGLYSSRGQRAQDSALQAIHFFLIKGRPAVQVADRVGLLEPKPFLEQQSTGDS